MPMRNRLNKPYMEVEGNRTTRKTSIEALTGFKETVIYGGGGQNRNWMKKAHAGLFK